MSTYFSTLHKIGQHMNIDEVYQFFGSANKASNAIGISRSLFSKWITNRAIPINRQREIEVITKGVLIAEKPKPEIVKTIFLPAFRYHDKNYGICQVTALNFIEGNKPKITYIIEGKKKSEKFAAFDSENLMQALDLVDSEGKTVYEGDILKLKSGKKLTVKNKEMMAELGKADKFKIIGNIFE